MKRTSTSQLLILACIGIYSTSERTLAATSGGQLIREIEQKKMMDMPTHQQQLQLDINKKTNKETKPTDSNIKIPISKFIYKGNISFDNETLNHIIKDNIENEYTFTDLQNITSKIEQFYHEKNYTFAHVFIPPQEINDGELIIEISEGKYGEIKINNKTKLKNNVIENSIRTIKTNKTIQSKELESTLIRLNKIPGIDAKSTLEPGKENGHADLIIDIEDANTVNGNLSIDNYGDKDTGIYRTNGNLAINNLSGRGDQLNLGLMASNLDNQYQRIAYQLPTNISDSKIGITYSSIQYKIGGASSILNLSGNANSLSIYLQQPIISQIDQYADIKIQYEDRTIKDKGDHYGGTIKKQINTISTTLSAGGVNIISDRSLSNFSVTYSTGRVAVHNPDWDSYYQKTRRFQGVFSKLVINTNQTKWITNKLSIFGQVYAQWADKNLDSSEKIGLGGTYGVRAYSASDDSGDIGFITNMELRHAIMPKTQISAFYDYGKIRLNKNGWGSNNPFIQRAAVGAALEWSSKHGSIQLISALPIAPGKSTLAKKAPSVWIQTSYSF